MKTVDDSLSPTDSVRAQIVSRLRLYHFTDTRNLESIRSEEGLCSLARASRRGIVISAAGGDANSQESDRANGMDEYVHLCLLDKHPMEYRARTDGRIQQSLFLAIKPEALELPGVRFVPGMSNTRGIRPVTLDEAIEFKKLEVADLDALYQRTDWKVGDNYARRVRAEKFEIIIPDFIPLEFVELPNG